MSDDGKVVGLAWVHPMCGNDPNSINRLRIDLSVLAGTLNPAGIDEATVDSAELHGLAEYEMPSTRSSMPTFQMRQVQSMFEKAEERRRLRLDEGIHLKQGDVGTLRDGRTWITQR